MTDFEIKTSADGRRRLVALAGVPPASFDTIASELGQPVRRWRKVGFVAARPAAAGERIETRWNGKETANVAEPGDWVATNLTPDARVLRDKAGNANTYIIRAASFPRLYARNAGAASPLAEGEVYRSISTVRALELTGGFELLAPWGEMQTADAGYLIDIGTEVYGNNRETFLATYMPAE